MVVSRSESRAALAAAWFVAVEATVIGAAALPPIIIWDRLAAGSTLPSWARLVALAVSVAPCYLLFAVALMVLSAASSRLCRWRTPADAAMPVTELSWPLLRWVCYLVSTHVVRTLAGTVLRASPLWALYLRLNGAKIGRRVFINSLTMSDHNLLEIGDGVVIGADVHLSGHTVERGVVATGVVRLGRGVTVGVGSVVDIDVEIGAGAVIGALSLVPKHTRLAGGITYVGVPARPLGGAAGRPRPSPPISPGLRGGR